MNKKVNDRQLLAGSSPNQHNFDGLNDPGEASIDCRESRVAGMSVIKALNKLTGRYHKAGKKLHLQHLSLDYRKLLAKAASVIEVNYWKDPQYQVLTNASGGSYLLKGKYPVCVLPSDVCMPKKA